MGWWPQAAVSTKPANEPQDHPPKVNSTEDAKLQWWGARRGQRWKCKRRATIFMWHAWLFQGLGFILFIYLAAEEVVLSHDSSLSKWWLRHFWY